MPLPWDAWLHMPKRQFASRKHVSPLGALAGPKRCRRVCAAFAKA